MIPLIEVRLVLLRAPTVRRIAKWLYSWATDHWSPVTDHRYVYDSWNLLAILDAQSSILQSFVWGLDLSGSEQGAGGIGGLLFSYVPRPLGEGSGEGANAYAYDGNGNVVALVDVGTQALSASYEYGPFGELIRATGPVAKANPYRFSTKYQDDETSLLYYGYRYYQPGTGRWLSRDPIEELGNENLFAFVTNDAVNQYDMFGLFGSNRNECRSVSAQLRGVLDRNSISNYGKDAEYLVREAIGEIIIPAPVPPLPGPGTPPGQGTGRIRIPGGITIGYRWAPMNPHVAAGISCRMKNMCKGVCRNPCCDWDKEWQEGDLRGRVVATLRDPTAPEGSSLRWVGAWCDLYPGELEEGLRRCRGSSVNCN